MRLRKVVLPLDEEEQIELLRITMDSDEKAALIFLKEHVARRVIEQNSGGCRPIFEWAGKEPSLFRNLKERGK